MKTPLHEHYWLSVTITKLFGRFQSEHCKMLMDAIETQPSMHRPWMLTNCIESYLRYSINPVDRFVIYTTMRRAAHNKAISEVLCGIASGWEAEEGPYEGTVAGIKQGYNAGSISGSKLGRSGLL